MMSAIGHGLLRSAKPSSYWTGTRGGDDGEITIMRDGNTPLVARDASGRKLDWLFATDRHEILRLIAIDFLGEDYEEAACNEFGSFLYASLEEWREESFRLNGDRLHGLYALWLMMEMTDE